MNLFVAAGMEASGGGRVGRAAVSRTLRVPLLNYKVVADAPKLFNFFPDRLPEQRKIAIEYAKTASKRSPHERSDMRGGRDNPRCVSVPPSSTSHFASLARYNAIAVDDNVLAQTSHCDSGR